VKQRNEFAVGGAIVLALLVVVAGALWLSETRLGQRPDQATVRFRTVGGLNVGAPVTLRGVRVGRVESVTLSGEQWVEANLRLDSRPEVPKNPAVIAAAASLFAEWEAQIVSLDDPIDDPNVRAELMTAKAAGPGAWPGATLPDVGQLTAQASRIASDIAVLTNRVGAVFDSTTAARARSSIQEFLSIVDELGRATKRQTGRVERVAGRVETGSADLASAARDLRVTMARIDSATGDRQLTEIVEAARGSSADLRQASADLRGLFAAAREHEVSLVRVLVAADSVLTRMQSGRGTLGLLASDSVLYRETTLTMQEFRKLLQDIQVNPRRYFKFSVF